MVLFLLFYLVASVGGDLPNVKNLSAAAISSIVSYDSKGTRLCPLQPHSSVEYRCLDPALPGGYRVCGTSEPVDTIVEPRCRQIYYNATPLQHMKCVSLSLYSQVWTHISRCLLDCGRVTDRLDDGVRRGEVPWHAGIFNIATEKYKQVCAGSLISSNVVLSAAHCFWTEQKLQLPASQFAVAVGKVYRSWNYKYDLGQTSHVKTIHLPPLFEGADSNYQDDIAVVIVARSFNFNYYVRPVCLHFNQTLESKQLLPKTKGMVAGWGLLREEQSPSALQVLELPYEKLETCISNSARSRQNVFTRDKICTEFGNSKTGLCREDSGVGLSFSLPAYGGTVQYYLRGVLSTSVSTDDNCRNSLSYYGFTSITKHESFIKQFWSKTGEFKCKDGSIISHVNLCDGLKHCADGSDESAWACADRKCHYRCNNGACVKSRAECNVNYVVPEVTTVSNIKKEVLDSKIEIISETSSVAALQTPLPRRCLPPPFPDHGTHVITSILLSNVSGENDNYELVTLTVTCETGYGVQGSSFIQCYNGFWPQKVPQCIRMCAVPEHPSVEYRCVLSGAQVGSRACAAHEPPGAVLSPRCREPYYYSAAPLVFMRCKDDARWDYVARCQQDCGRATPKVQPGLAIGGTNAKQGELPWHAGIYDKLSQPYMQVCGGSIISNNLIISAAHCFWQGRSPLPESQFSVAVGKLYRPWNDPVDDAQKSDVKQIHIPPRFRGLDSNFQDDIALVVVSHPFEYRSFVRPVCLSFDTNFEKQQLQTINKGKVAGWGLISANGKASPTLQVLELPYVDVNTCLDNSPSVFVQYITSDKICAGTRQTNSALCHGDSGGGLVFPAAEGHIERYYLRGVVSTAPSDENYYCNTAAYTAFTRIQQHQDFILPYLTDL